MQLVSIAKKGKRTASEDMVNAPSAHIQRANMPKRMRAAGTNLLMQRRPQHS